MAAVNRHARARDQAARNGQLPGCARRTPASSAAEGTYVDDIKLPGMLFGAMVRSPYAHARIKSINKAKALAVPGVVAVLTADDLKPVKLHWMPTLGGDVQAVLADGKVCFQMQEVAMVIASDRYSAADGADMVEVDYEELPAIVDPHKSMARRRADHSRRHRRQGQRRSRQAHASRTTSSPGKRATRPRTDAAFASADGDGAAKRS